MALRDREQCLFSECPASLNLFTLLWRVRALCVGKLSVMRRVHSPVM